MACDIKEKIGHFFMLQCYNTVLVGHANTSTLIPFQM